MDFKKLANYTFFIGCLVFLYGGWEYINNEPTKFNASKSQKGIFGGRNDIGNWLNNQGGNMVRKEKQQTATKIMIGGGIVFLIGCVVSASVKDKKA